MVFFLRDAVLASAFVHCKIMSLNLSRTRSRITFKEQCPQKKKQNKSSTLVLLVTMQCSQYTKSVYLISHLIINLQHKAKKV